MVPINEPMVAGKNSAFAEWVDEVPPERKGKGGKAVSSLSTVLDLQKQPNRWALLDPTTGPKLASRLISIGADAGLVIQTAVRGNEIYARIVSRDE